MNRTLREFAGLATLFGTLTAGLAAQQLIRRGSPEDVEARHAIALRQLGLTDDTKAVEKEFGLTDAALARAAAASDLPVVLSYDPRVAPNRVEAQRFPEQLMCLVRLPENGDGLDAIVNARLAPDAVLPVNTSPEEDKAFRQISFLRALQTCAPEFNTLQAERGAVAEFRREGGNPDFAAAETDWQILNGQFGISFSAPGGVDDPLRPNYFGDGLVLRAETQGKTLPLTEARAVQTQAIEALHDYARRHPLKFSAGAADNPRLGRQLVDDLLADKETTIPAAARDVLVAVQGAYDRLAGDTHHPAIRPVIMPKHASADEMQEQLVKATIEALHLLLGRGVRDEYGLLAQNGLTDTDAQAMIGPDANVTLIPAGDMPAGTAALKYVGGAHVLLLAGDGIGLRGRAGLFSNVPAGVDEARNRDFAKLALLENLRLIGQGPDVAPTGETQEAEITALRYFLHHGGDPASAAGEIGERTYENFVGIQKARLQGEFEPDSVTLRVRAALSGGEAMSGAQEQKAADEAADAYQSYIGAHKKLGHRKGAPDLAAVFGQMLDDRSVALSPRARDYLTLCADGLRFIEGQPSPTLAKLNP